MEKCFTYMIKFWKLNRCTHPLDIDNKKLLRAVFFFYLLIKYWIYQKFFERKQPSDRYEISYKDASLQFVTTLKQIIPL